MVHAATSWKALLLEMLAPDKLKRFFQKLAVPKLSSSVPLSFSCPRQPESPAGPSTQNQSVTLAGHDTDPTAGSVLSCVHRARAQARPGDWPCWASVQCVSCRGQSQPSGGWTGLLQTSRLASQVGNVRPHSFAPARPPSCLQTPMPEGKHSTHVWTR